MRNYDFAAAKRFVQMHADKIDTALLGMSEDWFWTAETIFEDGKFILDLDDEATEIGGIKGSYWATPLLEVEMRDGSVVRRECFTGEAEQDHPPAWFALGPLVEPVQRVREEKYIEGDVQRPAQGRIGNDSDEEQRDD